MSTGTILVTDETFQAEVLGAERPVLVDFWAPWCGPCRAIAPALDEIANQRAEQLKIAKLNVDENARTAGEFGVMSIPTMILFNRGQPVGQLVGFRPKAELVRILDQTLASLQTQS